MHANDDRVYFMETFPEAMEPPCPSFAMASRCSTVLTRFTSLGQPLSFGLWVVDSF